MLLLACLLSLAGGGCGNKSRRMGEGETLQYKRDLLQQRPRDLSPTQARKLFYDPSRTRGEIDRVFDDYARQYAEEVATEKARVLSELKPGATDPARTGGDVEQVGAPAADGSGAEPSRGPDSSRSTEPGSSDSGGDAKNGNSKNGAPREDGGAPREKSVESR